MVGDFWTLVCCIAWSRNGGVVVRYCALALLVVFGVMFSHRLGLFCRLASANPTKTPSLTLGQSENLDTGNWIMRSAVENSLL